MTKKIAIGDKAPDFNIEIAPGKNITLQNLLGMFVVLYFYPKDDTPGCTIEAKEFNELRPDFQQLNAEIIGISKDSLQSHDKFRSKYDLTFTLGSDTNGNACSNYGVWIEKSMFGKKYMGIDRVTFLIDPAGKIAFIWPKVSVTGHAQEVLQKIRELSIAP